MIKGPFPMQFDVTISLDKRSGTVNLFPLRKDTDAKISAAGYFKYREIYPFSCLNLLLELCKELDLATDLTYLE